MITFKTSCELGVEAAAANFLVDVNVGDRLATPINAAVDVANRSYIWSLEDLRVNATTVKYTSYGDEIALDYWNRLDAATRNAFSNHEAWRTSVFRSSNTHGHHIIPVSRLWANPGIQPILIAGRRSGRTFDFNGVDNIIPLSSIHHAGNHPDYLRAISVPLETIIRSSGTNIDKYDELMSLITRVRNQIRTEVINQPIGGTLTIEDLIIR